VFQGIFSVGSTIAIFDDRFKQLAEGLVRHFCLNVCKK